MTCGAIPCVVVCVVPSKLQTYQLVGRVMAYLGGDGIRGIRV